MTESMRRVGRAADHPAEAVPELMRGIGRFERSERVLPKDPRGRLPVLIQHLDPERFAVAFTLGSRAHEVLSNDQNRFAPPRALPPMLDLEVGAEGGEVRIVRYAWSPGAFQLLEDLLLSGHAIDTFEFVGLTWQLGQACEFLHRHGVLQGQWNAKSVVALPQDGGLESSSPYRFELLNTGVTFASPDAVPADYVARGYYPPELFLTRADVPDLGALDPAGDVYCLAAFLKDLLQRSCSTEELPSRATRLMSELHERAGRMGWRANAEELRRKELEILDHLYTARARTEYLIQEGLRPREDRADAATIARKADELYRTVTSYLRHLVEHGYEPFDAFAAGEGLLHYTTFAVDLQPSRIHGLEDSTLEIRGQDLPDELVRVTLNERSDGVHVESASSGRIVVQVEGGLPGGTYSVSINNRRTTATLEVVATQWLELEPASAHLPWAGCDPLEITVRGIALPRNVAWTLSPAGPQGPTPATDSAELVQLTAVGGVADGGVEGGEIVRSATPFGEKGAHVEDGELVRLRLPQDTVPGHYEIRANFLPTPLAVEVLASRPEPVVEADALSVATVRNHRDWQLELRGENLHPDMVFDLGELTPDGFHARVVDAQNAELTLPVGFPAGAYTLRVNGRDTPVHLLVQAPQWHGERRRIVRFGRRQSGPEPLLLSGTALPDPELGKRGYQLVDRRGRVVEGALRSVEPVPDADRESASAADVDAESSRHRLLVAPVKARGRLRLTFGGMPTGITLGLRHPTPRIVQLAAALVVLVGLVSGGLAVREHYRPVLERIEDATVFASRPASVVLLGRNLQQVELLPTAPAGPVGEQPVAVIDVASTGAAGRYELPLPATLPVGDYRLRPLGRFGAGAAMAGLAVRSPGFGVRPVVAHRFVDTPFELTAAAGFPLDDLADVALVPLSGRAPIEVPLTDGRFVLRAGSLPAAAEGDYRVRVDGVFLDEGQSLRIVGPRLVEAIPESVVPGRGDRIELELAVAEATPMPWLGLIGESAASDAGPGAAAGAEPVVVALVPTGVPVAVEAAVATRSEPSPTESATAKSSPAEASAMGSARSASTGEPANVEFGAGLVTRGVYRAEVPAGHYRIALGMTAADAVPTAASLRVLPRPVVRTVEPALLEPGKPTRIVLRGTNLAAASALSLRPVGATVDADSPRSIEVDRALVTPVGGAPTESELAGAELLEEFACTVTLPSGRFELAVTDHAELGSVELAVYDDCRGHLAAYVDGSADSAALLDCLESGRPADGVRSAAADRLFDRGEFAAAAGLYADDPSMRARFRAAFLKRFLEGAPVPMLRADAFVDAPGYAAAAAALGWLTTGEVVPWPAEASSWEAAFVRAFVEADAAVAGQLLDRCEELRVAAAAPVTPAPFPPFADVRAGLVVRGLLAGVATNPATVGRRLRDEVIADSAVWDRITPAQRAAALFWSGHTAHFYDGDDELARAHLERAAGGEAEAASWAPAYLAALGADAAASEQRPVDAGSTAWPVRFASLLADFRVVREEPNYDLLAAPGELRGTGIAPAARARAARLQRQLELLEATEPVDAFAHYSLLYAVRAAQEITWPQDYDGTLAEAHRQKLAGLAIAPELEPLRSYHLIAGAVAPLTLAQIVVMDKDTLRDHLSTLREIGRQPLPAPLRERAAVLLKKLSLPSVVWGSAKRTNL